MKENSLKVSVAVPAEVQVSIKDRIMTVTGPKGEVKKALPNPNVTLTLQDGKIILSAEKTSSSKKKIVGTYNAIIKNLIHGVVEGFVYKLKICAGHFPMTVAVNGNELQIKNFFGEKIPRTLKLKQGATVKVSGSEITVESPNKEIAGQVAADIETLTRRTGFDRRIFQDGIYITEKCGKQI